VVAVFCGGSGGGEADGGLIGKAKALLDSIFIRGTWGV
jgi:hypothetical protein